MHRVRQHPLHGFAGALGAVALLSVMDALMKLLVLAIGLFAVSVWRSLANLTLTGLLYLPRRRQRPTAEALKLHAGRGALVTVMAGLFFWGIARVPLAQALALSFIAPLIAMILAALVLGERIGARTVAGSMIAFAGVLMIVSGQLRSLGGDELLAGTVAILASALCYAFNIVLMRRQSLAAEPLEINFFQSLTVAVLWLGLVPVLGVPQWPAAEWPLVVLAAILSTAGGLLFSWAYARAEASYLAVTEYSGFLWASVLGWMVFREPVSLYTAAGAAMIVGGCVVAARSRLKAPPEIEAAA